MAPHAYRIRENDQCSRVFLLIQNTYTLYIHIMCYFELHTLYFEVPDSLVHQFVFVENPLAIWDSIETVLGWLFLWTSFPTAAAFTTALVVILMGRIWAGSTNIIWTINKSFNQKRKLRPKCQRLDKFYATYGSCDLRNCSDMII